MGATPNKLRVCAWSSSIGRAMSNRNSRDFETTNILLQNLKPGVWHTGWRPQTYKYFPQPQSTFSKFEMFQEANAKEPGTACIVDLSQSFERKRVGTFVPTLMKNTQLYSLSQSQFFTADSVEASQGHPTWFREDCRRYAGCIATDATQVSDPQRLVSWSCPEMASTLQPSVPGICSFLAT